ncbi:MAG: DUF72 domain-containing protein [Actinomycetota bacterium]
MIVVGTSGWQYDEWKPVLYQGVPKTRWLEHFATRFSACEVNNTFYRLPKPEIFSTWRARTPDEFVFAIKASRYITHDRRLSGAGEAVTALIERASGLGPKLGPILYQCPPSLKRDDGLLKAFVDLLPPYPKSTMEFRHESWLDDEVSRMLAEHNVARCITDSAHVEATASFAYFRLHGGPDYSQYSPEESAAWAMQIARLTAEGAESIYVFFDNDVQGNAVRDADSLRDRCEGLGLNVLRPAAGQTEGEPGPFDARLC